MRREIQPPRLLLQASELARPPHGAKQARNTDLRRAVSASYYAVFHSLTASAAAHLLPNGSHENRLRLTRSFDHGAVAEVCGWLVGTSSPRSSSPARPIIQPLLANTRLTNMADAFLMLQEQRHKADYDHLAPFSQTLVLSHISDAKLAIANLRQLCGSHDGQAFFVLVAMQKALR